MGRKRTCELPFCKGIVEGTHNKRRCDKDRNIHLHQIISDNVKRIMRYIESHDDFTANDVNMALFKNELDKNEKGSMYRLFQAMIRENYIVDKGKKGGLKVYSFSPEMKNKKKKAAERRELAKAKKLNNLIEADSEIEEEAYDDIESFEASDVKDLERLDEIPEKKEIQEFKPKIESKPEMEPKPEIESKQSQASVLSSDEQLLSIIKEFVYSQKGQWNHYDWLEFIKRQDIKEFNKSEEEIGSILEEQKTAYWIQRNS